MNSRFARNCRYLFAGFAVLLCANLCSASAKEDRKAIAQRIAAAITNHESKKLYVSDFLDSGSGRVDKGCFFSSAFSTLLAKQKRSFEVINRIDGQRLLTKAEFITTELQKPESPAKVAAATGADVLLMGKFTQEGESMNLELSLVESSTGKGFFYFQYREQSTDAFEALFPAAVDSTGTIFYFATLDGIGDPRCAYCPQPMYTDPARAKKINGSIILSAIFRTDGNLDQLRVVRGLEPTLEKSTLESMSRWKITPAQDASGNRVPVRSAIETTFKLY
jgi:hypothetical protein